MTDKTRRTKSLSQRLNEGGIHRQLRDLELERLKREIADRTPADLSFEAEREIRHAAATAALTPPRLRGMTTQTEKMIAALAAEGVRVTKSIAFTLDAPLITKRAQMAQATSTLTVEGLASLDTRDRDGDVIDPMLFNLDTFLKNGQLWVNHALWKTQQGNGVSAGVVEDARAVKLRSAKNGVDLIDVKRGSRVAHVDDQRLKAGQRGLYVRCVVTEEAVADLVRDGRLTSFSWAGVLLKNSADKIVAIDLREISLVNCPANADARFRIADEQT